MTSDQLLTLIIALLGFVSTVGVTVWSQSHADQQRRQDREAEAAQREADRTASAEAREADRKHSLELDRLAARRDVDAHWRDARQSAYQSILGPLDEASGDLARTLFDDEPGSWMELMSRISEPLSTIRLLSTDTVAGLAEDVNSLIGDVEMYSYLEGTDEADPTKVDAYRAKRRAKASAAREAIAKLIPAIRRELGSSVGDGIS